MRPSVVLYTWTCCTLYVLSPSFSAHIIIISVHTVDLSNRIGLHLFRAFIHRSFFLMAICHSNYRTENYSIWNVCREKSCWSAIFIQIHVWIAHSIWNFIATEVIYVGLPPDYVIYVHISSLKFWTNAFDGLFDKCSENKSAAFSIHFRLIFTVRYA